MEELPLLPDAPDKYLLWPVIGPDGNLWGVYGFDRTPDEDGGWERRLARLADDRWEVEEIKDTHGLGPLAFDSAGNPALAYSAPTSFPLFELRFIRKEGGVWTDYFVDPGGAQLMPQLFFDSQDRAVILFSHSGAPLKIARETAGGWEVTGHPLGENASWTTATLDRNDGVVLASSFADGLELQFCRETDTGWDIELVAEVQGEGVMYPYGIAIDSRNRAKVLYCGGTGAPLQIAREQAGGGFTTGPVEGYVEDFDCVSLGIGQDNLEVVFLVPEDVAGIPLQVGYYNGSTWQWEGVFHIAGWREPTQLFSADGIPLVQWKQLLASFW